MSLVFAWTLTHETGSREDWEAGRPWPPRNWPPVPDVRNEPEEVTMTAQYGEEDPPETTVLTTFRRSRAARTCGTCLGEIRPGEQYARHFLPANADHGRYLIVIEHASACICYAVLGQDKPS
jgi:hypothetical protein